MKWLRGALCCLLGAAPLGAQSPAPLPRLLLNHVYFVLDSATYHDIDASPFLASQFAGHEVRTTESGGLKWSGIYFYGRHTYLEIFGPHGLPGSQPGDVGIGLASEVPGGIRALMQRFGSQHFPFDTLTRAKTDSSGVFPWFLSWRASGPDLPSDRTALWVMEYSAAMAQRMARRDSLPDTDRSRDRFIADRLMQDQLLAELIAATFALPVDDIAKVSRTLDRAGVLVIPEGEGAVIQLEGFTLHLVPAWDRPGVRKLEFSLNREALANPTYRFGPASRLRFGPGRIAVWEFSLK
jgi:hypothetical protein